MAVLAYRSPRRKSLDIQRIKRPAHRLDRLRSTLESACADDTCKIKRTRHARAALARGMHWPPARRRPAGAIARENSRCLSLAR